ncbi:hypothetical protein LBMAG27_01440 [Bacteroidota bacterium]|nr:hypothetical protein LBMAG27_01440 [Bacteroidota bacterium]
MSVYKFRVAFEEDENIYRDIEIQPSQTMKELNAIISSAFALPEKSSCRMFRSNDNWHKQDEMDLNPKAIKKGKNVLMPMIIHFIDDPHQRFLYEFETPKQSFSLLIELISINTVAKAGETYPKVLKSVGPSPVKKEDLMAHLSKKVVEDDELVYGVDKEEDDIEGMGQEGEEGEEVEGELADDMPDEFGGEFNMEEGAEDFKE